MTNNLAKMLGRIAREVYDRKPPKTNWHGAAFEAIYNLRSIDQRGQSGEELAVKILTDNNCDVIYNPNKASREKDWDLISNNIKIEIKLATLGKDGKMFQHENLERSRKFDAMLIIDVAPDDLYLSCYDFKALPWSTMHRRPTGVYKFDLPLKKLIEGGCAVKTAAEFFSKYQAMEAITLARLGRTPGEADL